MSEGQGQAGYSPVVETARSYYNSNDADNFYHTIWGGEDIHVGLYYDEKDTIFEASQRTVEKMAEHIKDKLQPGNKVLDLGAGYGGSARYLVKTYGVEVVCLNLSEVENERNRTKNKEQGLESKIEVIDGDFENVPLPDNSYDIIWSQDAILHSGDRPKVFKEVQRLAKPGALFVFTDPMQSDDCPEGVLQPIYDRIHLSSLGAPGYYEKLGKEMGWTFLGYDGMPEQLVNHYSRVREELEKRRADLEKVVSVDYIERMKKGLGHWVDGGKNGYLAWGILRFRLP